MIIPTTSASFLLLPAIHIPFLCPFVQEPICFKKVRCGAYTGLLNSTITYFFRKGNRLPKSVIYCKVCVIFVIVHRAWKAEGKQTSSSLVRPFSFCFPHRASARCFLSGPPDKKMPTPSKNNHYPAFSPAKKQALMTLPDPPEGFLPEPLLLPFCHIFHSEDGLRGPLPR